MGRPAFRPASHTPPPQGGIYERRRGAQGPGTPPQQRRRASDGASGTRTRGSPGEGRRGARAHSGESRDPLRRTHTHTHTPHPRKTPPDTDRQPRSTRAPPPERDAPTPSLERRPPLGTQERGGQEKGGFPWRRERGETPPSRRLQGRVRPRGNEEAFRSRRPPPTEFELPFGEPSPGGATS